jgi:rSAM/selenodomain-associated transferase 2
MGTTLSVIIPTLRERRRIADTLQPLQELRRRGHEVILVDGGSDDGTRDVAAPLVDSVLTSEKGRARQMNAGARAARGDVLLFLHADTLVPPAALDAMLRQFPRCDRPWGWFDVRLSGRGLVLRLTEHLMNARSRLTRISTGDHAIFVRRKTFARIGGFPDIPLMEDVALSRALKRQGRPLCLKGPVVTSSRRWEEHGVWRTILLMWRLRLAYALGADPRRLARSYDS